MSTAPVYEKIVELLGIDPNTISALISLTVLVVPRMLIILDYEKTHKKEKEEKKEGEINENQNKQRSS